MKIFSDRRIKLPVRIGQCIVVSVFFPVLCLCSLAYFYYGKISYEQIILNCALETLPYVPLKFIFSIFIFCFFCFSLTVLYCYLQFCGVSESFRSLLHLTEGRQRLLRRLNHLFVFLCPVLSLFFIVFAFRFPVPGMKHPEYSLFFEEQYVPVKEAQFRFPAKKMNLIHLVCESLENSFRYPEFYGGDLMPELVRLERENDSFPGCVSVRGTDCTIMSLYSGQFAVPYLSSGLFSYRSSLKKKAAPFPELISLFQVLQQNGYQTAYMLGGNYKFARTDQLYDRVPGIRIRSWEDLHRTPEYEKMKKHSVWGVNDRILLKYARQELSELQNLNKPFAIQISTIDTHFPDGFILDEEDRIFDDYRDVVRAQSRMVREFLDWLKLQPFYENTLVVITGDHVAFDKYPAPGKVKRLHPGFQRTVYNCLIHAAVRPAMPQPEKERRWAMFDLMPTVLEAMGVTWQSHRLGVGTSLYSGEKTWLEKKGLENYETETRKASRLFIKLAGRIDLPDQRNQGEY